MYRISWDFEDCRFNYFDGTYWNNFHNAITAIKNACNIDKTELMKVMSDDGDEDFSTWVNWCIDNFLYAEEIKFEDA